MCMSHSLWIDHGQHRSAYWLLQNVYTHGVCALVTFILFSPSCTNHFELLGDPIVPQCLNFQSYIVILPLIDLEQLLQL